MATKALRITAPTLAPLTLDQVKRHLALPVSDGSHDVYLTDLIEFVRDQWEADTSEVVMSSTFTQTYEVFPAEFYLLRRPVSSITHVKYYDANNSLQTLSSAYYYLDNTGVHPEVCFTTTAVIPTTYERPDSVIVTYVAGAATQAAVHPVTRQALLLAISHAFEHRGIVSAGQWNETPKGYESLVKHHSRSNYP
jgi:uncharacterized phiE125 gp8 family phage protein